MGSPLIMKKELIHKLGLKPTNKQFGLTFQYGITIYQFAPDIFITRANTVGIPLPKGILLIYSELPRTWAKVSEDLLLDIREPACSNILSDSIFHAKNKLLRNYIYHSSRNYDECISHFIAGTNLSLFSITDYKFNSLRFGLAEYIDRIVKDATK